MATVQLLRSGERSAELLTDADVMCAPPAAVRVVAFATGIWLLATGIALCVNSGLGLGPWQVLETGIARRTGLTLGTVVVIESVVALVMSRLVFDVRPGPGTLVAALIGGPTVDLMVALLPVPSSTATVWGSFIAGVGVFSVGLASYLAADLGPTAQDSLFVGVIARFGLSFRRGRFVVDATLTSAGLVLGGQFGVGTALILTLVPLLSAALVEPLRTLTASGTWPVSSDATGG